MEKTQEIFNINTNNNSVEDSKAETTPKSTNLSSSFLISKLKPELYHPKYKEFISELTVLIENIDLLNVRSYLKNLLRI